MSEKVTIKIKPKKKKEENNKLNLKNKLQTPISKKNNEITPRSSAIKPTRLKIKPKKINEVDELKNAENELKPLISKVNNFVNNERVEPLNWVLPNKKEFGEWLSKTFIKYKSTGSKNVLNPSGTGFTAYNYQKLLRDYMQNNSPYRGILLYHGLGSGKTCSSILIAENLKSTRNVIVMLPASLRSNFINDGLLFCGNKGYKNQTEDYKQHYNFISYNANNTVAQIKKIGSLDHKVIIIEEVHNLISKIINSINGTSIQGGEIYQMLMNAQNSKIIALSGTPLINDPLEAAILFNILRGFIEITYYRIITVASKYGEYWNFEQLEKQLKENKNIDYLEINKINKSIEFHIKPKNYEQEYRDTCEFIDKTCYENGVSVRYLELSKVPLFPIDDDGELFRNYFININEEKGNSLKNKQIFKQRILGLVSYYESQNPDEYPQVIGDNYYRIEMSNYQLQMYELLRAKERLTEKKSTSSSKKDTKSTFRVFSRQACNFVFPETIHRPYPDPTFIVSILQKNNKNVDPKMELKKIVNMIKKEEDINDNKGAMAKDYKIRIDNSIEKLVENGMTYLTPNKDGLNKLSPKMALILSNMAKCNGLIFVYSNFRTLEGVEIFSKIMDFNGYSYYKDNEEDSIAKSNRSQVPLKKYAIYSGMEKEEDRKNMLKIFTSSQNKRGELIKVLFATSAGAEGLDLKNIRQIHIMDPYWNQMRNKQVIGRGVRRNSHIDLPKSERNIEIFRYFSILPKANSILTKDKMSTDEYIQNISIKKQYIIDEVLDIFKECSFDCFLNYGNANRTYRCFTFGKDQTGFSYYPTIAKDLISTIDTQGKAATESILTPGVYYKGQVYLYDQDKKIFYLYHDKTKNKVDINVKESYALYINKNENKAYKKKMVNSGNMSNGFTITKDSKLKKME